MSEHYAPWEFCEHTRPVEKTAAEVKAETVAQQLVHEALLPLLRKTGLSQRVQLSKPVAITVYRNAEKSLHVNISVEVYRGVVRPKKTLKVQLEVHHLLNGHQAVIHYFRSEGEPLQLNISQLLPVFQTDVEEYTAMADFHSPTNA